MGQSEAIFGHFVLSGEGLTRDGKPIAMGQRGIALLRALVEADGPVDKAALMQAGWPGTLVEEGNLTVQIAGLRKALGPRDDGQEWIVTVPRVGYRLLRGGAPGGKAEASSVPTLAVLPFQNFGGDPEQEYFADGVVEDIITALSRFRSFAVIARNSSFVYKGGAAVDVRQVARELGVGYVLEGSVRRAGTRLRVTAQLIDGGSGAHLWAQSYDGTTDDVFDMQDRITESVVGVVEPNVQHAEIERSRRERPGSLAAYDLYLRAVPHFMSMLQDGNAEANRLLREAVRIEPENAIYLARLGFTYGVREAMGWPPFGDDDHSQFLGVIQRALAAAPRDPLMMAVAALAFSQPGGEPEMAVGLAERSLAANPNSVEVNLYAGLALLHLGGLDQAIGCMQRSMALSPGDPIAFWAMTGIAHGLIAQHRDADALDWAERSLATNRYWPATYWMLIAANAQLGRIAEAHRWVARFLEVQPNATLRGIMDAQSRAIPERSSRIFEGLQMAGLPEGGDG